MLCVQPEIFVDIADYRQIGTALSRICNELLVEGLTGFSGIVFDKTGNFEGHRPPQQLLAKVQPAHVDPNQRRKIHIPNRSPWRVSRESQKVASWYGRHSQPLSMQYRWIPVDMMVTLRSSGTFLFVSMLLIVITVWTFSLFVSLLWNLCLLVTSDRVDLSGWRFAVYLNSSTGSS